MALHFRDLLGTRGLVISGTSPDGNLVEAIELPNHPWFVAVQCHPEFKSKPTKAHPLFQSFIHAAIGRRESKKKPESQRPYVTQGEAVASA